MLFNLTRVEIFILLSYYPTKETSFGKLEI